MLETFEFNDKKLLDIGAVITDKPSYVLSVRELDLTALPGKSGDIITDKKRFKNISVTYKITSVPTLGGLPEQDFVFALGEWLLSTYGYRSLRDTYNPGYYRKAVCTGISNPVVEASGVVSAAVTFNCDPFLYNDNGLNKVVYNSTENEVDTTLENPEMWDSEPVIKIIGNGSFSCLIGDVTFGINNVVDEITIDKPNENVYDKDGVPCNDKITAYKLPSLLGGTNVIRVIGVGDTEFTLEIIPNWRRL